MHKNGGNMNINTLLNELDLLFSEGEVAKVEPFLRYNIEVALEKEEFSIALSLLNELIGFYRDLSEHEKALNACEQSLRLMQKLNMEGSVPYANSLLNVANALRAAGKLGESLQFFNRVYEIYSIRLGKNDILFATLYNNWSLLYQEMREFEKAVTCLEYALQVIVETGDLIKIATTHGNLGLAYIELERYEEAREHIEEALKIYEAEKDLDFHYSATAAAYAQLHLLQGNLPTAIDYFKVALREQYRHCGKSDFFYRILEGLQVAETALGLAITQEPSDAELKNLIEINQSKARTNGRIEEGSNISTGMDIARDYFNLVVLPSFQKEIPELMHLLAFGLIGEGSECFGFDDELSRDHDFGPSICIWMQPHAYRQNYAKVKRVYDNLPKEFMGLKRRELQGKHRVGIMNQEEFFKYYTGYANAEIFKNKLKQDKDVVELAYFDSFDTDYMACFFNGEIFYDEGGVFTQKINDFRNLFTKDYPSYFRLKIAESFSLMAQYGQYNYIRCMKRKDFVTARICIDKFMEETLKCIHYFNQTFPPYYKWLQKSALRFEKLGVLATFMDAIVDFSDQRQAWNPYYEGDAPIENVIIEDKLVGIIECVARLVIHQVMEDNIGDFTRLNSEETYLDAISDAIRKRVEQDEGNKMERAIKEKLVNDIVIKEWEAFDKVDNIGGRADCQDNFSTFSIMRKSQYLTWNVKMLERYLADFEDSINNDWNLIAEKYARMMASTSPMEYEELKDKLPVKSERQLKLVEQICEIQVAWMVEFTKAYPGLGDRSRIIHSSDDNMEQTSYETYLRGELLTYSEDMITLYAKFIVDLSRRELNLAKLTMEETIRLYGYESLDVAENLMQKK